MPSWLGAPVVRVCDMKQFSPTPERYLEEAKRFFLSRTRADSLNPEPIFRRCLRGYHWGHHRDFTVELMPNLVLRVRDQRSGQVLAQSKPGQLDQLDAVVPLDFDERLRLMGLDQQP